MSTAKPSFTFSFSSCILEMLEACKHKIFIINQVKNFRHVSLENKHLSAKMTTKAAFELVDMSNSLAASSIALTTSC